MSLLEVRDLRTRIRTARGQAVVVDGVDLTMGPGEALGVVGESGSGKSLLALSLMGLLPEPGGEILEGSSIRFRGQELVGASERTLRGLRGRGMAMVFQEPMTSLNPVFTAGSQIGEALKLHKGLKGSGARRTAAGLLGEVGIDDPEGCLRAYPHQLSGGMRQRVMLAMALAGDPDLLLADEPTTALDPTVQAQILDLLGEIRERRGMGLMLISHDVAVVGRICDRVVVFYAGRIMEEGGAEQVLRRPEHPYTRALLASRPSVEGRETRLAPIVGEVPEPSAWPGGCRFHPRCLHAWGRCEEMEPDLLISPGGGVSRRGRARCWLVAPEGGEDGG